MSQNQLPDANSPDFRDEDWISAAETMRRARAAIPKGPIHEILTKRAHVGLLRAHAALMVVNDVDRSTNVLVGPRFWWAEGQAALEQNWALGDFETWFDHKARYQVFGVRFYREDVDLIVRTATAGQDEPAMLSAHPPESGGRPMSELWPDWVAELAQYIHDEGYPEGKGAAGADMLIAAIETRLVEQGKKAPGRTTVQATVKAVLQRHRSAGN